MPRDIIAWALAQQSSGQASQEVAQLKSDIQDGTVIAARAYADENGININTYYAKIADVPSISTDIYPYTDEEIDAILGV